LKSEKRILKNENFKGEKKLGILFMFSQDWVYEIFAFFFLQEKEEISILSNEKHIFSDGT